MLLLDPTETGTRLPVTTPEDEVITAAKGQDRVVLEFDAFRDGRGFSLAAILRAEGFDGQLVAAGKVLPDQVRHLRRSGFDAVELSPNADRAPWERLNTVFSAAYQPGGADRLIWPSRTGGLSALADRLNAELADGGAEDILAAALNPALGRKVMAISSFGAESAVLLHLVSRIRPDLPVLFLETGQHFFQTLSYRRHLTDRLGLTGVQDVKPDPAELAQRDPGSDLYKTAPDACCSLRKVEPLAKAAAPFDTRITGRKRYQNDERASLKPFEVAGDQLVVNPLYQWSAEDIEAWLAEHKLPRHPLVEQGYPSIGCWPCTRPVEPDADARSGRWADQKKTECGIHRIPALADAD